MEYILVRFDSSDIRDVLANASAIGKTEKTLMLDTGFYEITLSGSGFTPDKWVGSVSATSATDPFSIAFSKTATLDKDTVGQKGARARPGREHRRKRPPKRRSTGV
jgi:hypothetical protein